MTLTQLQHIMVEKLVFHSLDQSLYNLSAVVNGREEMITNEQGERLVTRSLLEMQKQVAHINAKRRVLRQQSAYDEMVGGPAKVSNQLEIPLGDNALY